MTNLNLTIGKFEDVDLSDQKIDLVFMDPPDNEKRKYNGYTDNLPNEEYVELLHQWTTKACHVTSGPVFISVAERWIGEMESIISKNNISLIQRIYWHYTFGQANKKRYTPSIRPIYWLNNGIIYDEKIKVPSMRMIKYNDKRANPFGKLPDNMWEYSRICGTFREKRKWHCTQHPEALMERIILGHSKEGETILDPFLGSGTTAIVCQKLNRDCIGIDCSGFYIKKIKEELSIEQ